MSSLGDVIHNLPVATDLARYRPDLAIDWLVEEQYVPIVAMHPSVSRIVPIALRRWRRTPLSRSTWQEFSALRARLREQRYEAIIDTQGLLKSVFASHQACGPVYGFGRHTARDPLASFFYSGTFEFTPETHKIMRYRGVAARALEYTPDPPIDYGIRAGEPSSDRAASPYCVVFHSTARAAKLWSEQHWIEMLSRFTRAGVNCLLPWGSESERLRSERLAQGQPKVIVPPKLSVTELAAVIGRAELVIGVDTGLMHLAAALSRPVVGIFCDSNPVDACPIGPGPTAWRGQIGAPPSIDTVTDAVRDVCPALL
jgi:heptosyltransferase-1